MRKLLSIILISAVSLSLFSCVSASSAIPEDALVIDYSGDSKVLADAFEEAISDLVPAVTVTGTSDKFSMEDLMEMDHGCFWVESFSISGRGKTTTYRFNYYDLTSDEISSMKAEIDSQITEIIMSIPAGSSSWDKLLTVHDELVRRIDYDRSEHADHCMDCYGALVLHRATCSGYASAFYLISDKLNLPCPLVYSETHTWNKMLISSDERYIDVTWDDPDQYSSEGMAYICHDYFGLTEEEIGAVDQHQIVRNADINMIYDIGIVGNYHRHYGYLLSSSDQETVQNALLTQLNLGSSVLTLRFATDRDYITIRDNWTADDYSDLLELLGSLGVDGEINVWFNDDIRTVNIGL